MPLDGFILVVNFNPTTDTTALNNFRTTYGLPATVIPVGPYMPNLANSTHTIELARPSADGRIGTYINVDKTEYRDMLPWPALADGL